MQPEIRRYFQMEAKELIDKLTRGAAQLDGSTPDPANVQQMQRAAHTLKGAAHVVGELEIAQQAHAVEDLLAQQLKAPAAATAASVLALLDSVAARLQRSEPAAEAAGKTGLTPVREAAAPARPAVAHAPGASGFMHPGHSARTVRVELTQTERLLDHIGESTRLAASMRQALRAGAEAARPGRSGRYEQETGPLEHLDQLDRLDRQLSELFAVASQLRLIPTAELLFEVERMVRAHAATLGQPVACRASGGGERVDVHVLEVLEAALLHLVRNAIAHGIEPVAERRRQGKPETATITVDLRRAGSRILLTCADDGRGIDLEVIRRSAVEQGRCGPAEARRMGETELMALLFAPGFSTAGTIDQISGRGIGLDAVREAAESLDGHVQVRSTAGQGATFTIDVPSTLFAVRVLEIRAAGETFAIPFGAVEQTLLLAPHHTLVTVGERAGMALLMEGETVPFVRLNDLLPADPGSCEGSVAARSCLIVAEGGRRAAVAVDSFAGAGDLLIRPLPSFLGALPFVGGTALAASGEPKLVLDPASLIAVALAGDSHPGSRPGRRNGLQPGSQRRPASEVHGASAETLAPILVIDDSMTTRVLEQSILEGEGYAVELATSGEEALQMARRRSYSLFLVDVEMPGISGFEFVERVRADPELRQTPAIMVTSLDSAESRERGRSAGAESYVVKGEFNQKVYLDRIRAIVGLPQVAVAQVAVAQAGVAQSGVAQAGVAQSGVVLS